MSNAEEESQLQPLRFVYDFPFISQRKHAIVQLVAKYTVLDPGQLDGHDFDFLNPTHSLHPLYQSLVSQYRLVKEGAQPLAGNVLQRAIERARLDEKLDNSNEKDTRINSKEEPVGETGQDEEFARIDWQDFVVLETVEFFSADLNGTSNLSAPFTIEELELQKHGNSRTTSSEPMFKSAITGEMVPASQYNEHIRILTLDPGYHKQRSKEIERQNSSNLDIDNVAENLAQLKKKRRKLLEDTS